MICSIQCPYSPQLQSLNWFNAVDDLRAHRCKIQPHEFFWICKQNLSKQSSPLWRVGITWFCRTTALSVHLRLLRKVWVCPCHWLLQPLLRILTPRKHQMHWMLSFLLVLLPRQRKFTAALIMVFHFWDGRITRIKSLLPAYSSLSKIISSESQDGGAWESMFEVMEAIQA